MTSFARFGLFALVTVTACDWPTPQSCEGDWAALPPEAEPAKRQMQTVAQVLPAASSAIDMLFVIDDSSSMTDEQAQLGIWSRELFAVLGSSGELPDLHIAVTSSSVAIPELTQCVAGAGGTLHVGRATLEADRFIRDVAGTDGRDRNYPGTLTETFAMMARVGDSGCGFEQPFQAARLALSKTNPSAKGFLRDEALLLVVFVTDEDDCSAREYAALFSEPAADACSNLGTLTSYRCFEHGVRCYDDKGSRELGERQHCRPAEDSEYVQSVVGFADFLKSVKPNPAQVVVAGIYGKPNGVFAIRDERVTTHDTPRLSNVCGGGGAEGTGATPAIRMNALMAEFGGRASQSNICESELSWAMRDVGLVTYGVATRSPCLRGPVLDADSAAPGIQPACRVEAVSSAGKRSVPRCDRSDATGCFTVDIDAACGDTETQLAFHADAAANETLRIDCDVDAGAHRDTW